MQTRLHPHSEHTVPQKPAAQTADSSRDTEPRSSFSLSSSGFPRFCLTFPGCCPPPLLSMLLIWISFALFPAPWVAQPAHSPAACPAPPATAATNPPRFALWPSCCSRSCAKPCLALHSSCNSCTLSVCLHSGSRQASINDTLIHTFLICWCYRLCFGYHVMCSYSGWDKWTMHFYFLTSLK